jgi:hypothetical protein
MIKQCSGSLRVRLYRGLALIAVALMAVSFSLPWWTCVIQSNRWIKIYGWGLQHNLVDLAASVSQDITPAYQKVLAWLYLAACAAVIIFSAFRLKRKKSYLPTIVLGIAGLSYIAYAAIAGFVVIADRVKVFGVNLTGQTLIKTNSWMTVIHSKFDTGFYLAFAAGILCVLLAGIRFIIVKKAQSEIQVRER